MRKWLRRVFGKRTCDHNWVGTLFLLMPGGKYGSLGESCTKCNSARWDRGRIRPIEELRAECAQVEAGSV